MTITMFHRASLRITSKATALEFYEGVRDTACIPCEGEWLIRVEPGNLIGFITKEDLRAGRAWATPNLHDPDGAIAYRYRKYINAYLNRE